MDLLIKDSEVISRAVKDALTRTLGEDGYKLVHGALGLDEIRTSDSLRQMNEFLLKRGSGSRVKELFERLSEDLSSKVDVKVAPSSLKMIEQSTENVTVEVMNMFDVPLVFDVTLEDRDNFLPVVYDKHQEAYFNKFTIEKIIDSGNVERFRFKVGAGPEITSKNTTLFVVVRSREVDGLNWIGRLKIDFSGD